MNDIQSLRKILVRRFGADIAQAALLMALELGQRLTLSNLLPHAVAELRRQEGIRRNEIPLLAPNSLHQDESGRWILGHDNPPD